MLLEKPCYMKTKINFRDQTWNIVPAKYYVKDFILPHKYHPLNFCQRFRVISTPSDI